jgi:selenocysteine lyase/cysteine desulfurase
MRMTEWGVDWVALSAHKVYAPFGVGALIGWTGWLESAPPYLAGGGATDSVSTEQDTLHVLWRDLPERHEAGSPNLVGVHALATACDTLTEFGWDAITEHERELTTVIQSGLRSVPGVHVLSMWGENAQSVGVTSFVVDGVDGGLLSTVLAAEHGIGVRQGAFCAHLATRMLTSSAGDGQANGALRASVGLGTTREHAERLVSALGKIVRSGPQWDYRVSEGEWVPVPDPRPIPELSS